MDRALAWPEARLQLWGMLLHEHDDAGSCQGRQKTILLARCVSRPGPGPPNAFTKAQATPLNL